MMPERPSIRRCARSPAADRGPSSRSQCSTRGRGASLIVRRLSACFSSSQPSAPWRLALGLSMIVREFDLSVGGMLSLAGCLAVMTGADVPLLGVAIAVCAGFMAGLIQGGIMVWLRLNSVGGDTWRTADTRRAHLCPHRQRHHRLRTAWTWRCWSTSPFLGVFSIRNGVAIMAFVAAAIFMGRTRVGRDVIAVGSDRRAALVAGVKRGPYPDRHLRRSQAC